MSNEISGQSKSKFSFEGRIFFYCCEVGYQHLSVCIAEGLQQLGIAFSSNINYWQIEADREEYLFCYNPNVTPDDCDIVVVEQAWIVHHQSLPDNLFHPQRKYVTVYLDDMDGPITPSWYPACQNFDFILKTHLNSKSKYPANFIPWVFGLSNRILRETNNLPNFRPRERKILANFRVPHEQVSLVFFEDIQAPILPGMVRIDSQRWGVKHPLRQIFRKQFISLIEKILAVDNTIESLDEPSLESYHYLQWKQTSKRHNPKYYQRLKAAVACAAFGGYLVPDTEAVEPYVELWDSWRLWESLAAGCVTFHVDFDKYGILLPVMPENWQHFFTYHIKRKTIESCNASMET